jgi:hypothetical protein
MVAVPIRLRDSLQNDLNRRQAPVLHLGLTPAAWSERLRLSTWDDGKWMTAHLGCVSYGARMLADRPQLEAAR